MNKLLIKLLRATVWQPSRARISRSIKQEYRNAIAGVKFYQAENRNIVNE